jgi:hypothetical protein
MSQFFAPLTTRARNLEIGFSDPSYSDIEDDSEDDGSAESDVDEPTPTKASRKKVKSAPTAKSKGKSKAKDVIFVDDEEDVPPTFKPRNVPGLITG